MMDAIAPFESDNQTAYILLLRIEVALRELLKNSLESVHGRSWQKRLPGDLLKKIRQSQLEEHKPQFDFVRLGPLYYLTLGELLTALQQRISLPVVERLGGDSFVKQLENTLSPRNALCHSRPVSKAGLAAIEALYIQFETALGKAEVARLLANSDTGLFPEDAAALLKDALVEVAKRVAKLPPALPYPPCFETALEQYWWTDEALAGFHPGVVEAAIQSIRGYNELPAGVGSASARQAFCEEARISTLLSDAISELVTTLSANHDRK